MKKILLTVILLVSGCGLFERSSYHSGAPGYLDVRTSMYDNSRTVYLKPASLFDPDDSPSIFRLGFYWETRMNDKIYFIVNIPVGGIAEYENIKLNISNLFVKYDNKKHTFLKAEKAVTVNEKDMVINKEYDIEIRYIGSLAYLEMLLKSKDVVMKVSLPGKSYEGRFDVNSEARKKYIHNKNNAFNGATRFIKETQ